MSLKSQNKIDTNRVELEVVVDAETFEKGLAAAFKKQRRVLKPASPDMTFSVSRRTRWRMRPKSAA